MNFDFSKNYILENDFVRLRPLKLEDVDSLLNISNESDLWTYFLKKGNGLENLTLYVKSTIQNRNAKKEYPFIVYDKVKKQYSGAIRFYDYSRGLKTIKLRHTWYGKNFRGTGLNKNCKYLLFEFAFEKLDVERIGFEPHMDNKISIAAMKSLGSKQEGVLRAFIPSEDGKGRVDIILLSILKNEWYNNIKSELKYKFNIKT